MAQVPRKRLLTVGVSLSCTLTVMLMIYVPDSERTEETVAKIFNNTAQRNRENSEFAIPIHLKQVTYSPDGTFVDIMYEPPSSEPNIPSPVTPFHVPADIFREVVSPPEYVTLNKQTAEESFVFVTAASNDFFKRTLGAIVTVQKHFPSHKIVYYDMGLSLKNIVKIKRVCDVEYKVFNYSRYPEHVQSLTRYAWKPLIILQELRLHPGVFWIDSSIQFVGYSDIPFRQAVGNEGALFFTTTGHSTYAVTHKDMFKYLPTEMSKMVEMEQREANCVLFYRTKYTYENIIMWMTFCSLDEKCIAPIENRFCRFDKTDPGVRWTSYSKCHRFDQSIMNILMANNYQFDAQKTYASVRIAEVHRIHPRNIYVKMCMSQLRGNYKPLRSAHADRNNSVLL